MKKLIGCLLICFFSLCACAQWTTSGSNIYYTTGAVSIGTASPNGYQLAVNGSAIFTAAYVKPYTSWPDYVFKPDYRLPNLDSVADYIRRNSHLPGIPSAAAIAEKGLDLGGNQAAMLKKIEELTLYIIEQNDLLRKQEELLKEYQGKIQDQEHRLERLEKLLKP